MVSIEIGKILPPSFLDPEHAVRMFKNFNVGFSSGVRVLDIEIVDDDTIFLETNHNHNNWVSNIQKVDPGVMTTFNVYSKTRWVYVSANLWPFILISLGIVTKIVDKP